MAVEIREQRNALDGWVFPTVGWCLAFIVLIFEYVFWVKEHPVTPQPTAHFNITDIEASYANVTENSALWLSHHYRNRQFINTCQREVRQSHSLCFVSVYACDSNESDASVPYSHSFYLSCSTSNGGDCEVVQ